jgi:phosphatidylinositol glycan class B
MIYSLAGHKEWRFIHPLLPLLHLLAAKSFVDLSSGRSREYILRLRIFVLLTLPASMYIVLLYCSGPIDVMAFLRSLPRAELQNGVGFLMPCHSTPGHAYLHRKELTNGRTWSLGCEPPLEYVPPRLAPAPDATHRHPHFLRARNQNLATYRDQTTVFFDVESPLGYLTRRFPASVDPAFPPLPFPASVPGRRDPEPYAWAHAWPLHLVFFGALLDEEGVRELLEARGYREVWNGGRAWERDSDERKGGVRVWRYSEDNAIGPS